MNANIYIRIGIVLVLALLLTMGSLAVAQASKLHVIAAQSARLETDTVLDVCMYGEPQSLYYYAQNRVLEQNQILSAVYDGPMDTRSYAYQPVIFEAVPTLDNGLAITEMVTVTGGDLIVDSSGINIVVLNIGTSYFPSGCYDSSCAITYTGGLVEMEHMVVTQTLSANLTWSDGEPLTSADMLYSFNLNAHPDTPADKFDVDRTVSYVSTSLTETVWTGLPGYFPFDYSQSYWNPLPEHIWGAYSAAELVSATISSRTPLGWGPYVIDEWVAGSHISMHKNPLYFRAGEGLPRFTSLIVHFGTESGGILDGTCDVVVNSLDPMSTMLGYDYAGYLTVASTPNNIWEHLDFGIQSADIYTGFAALSDAFQDVRVRQAFAYCIDRQTIADTVYYGQGVVPNAFILDEHPYYPPDAVIYPYDPLQGQALLTAAGWIDSNGNGIRDQNGIEFEITLKTSTASLRVTVASMVAEQLALCGIQTTPIHMPASQLFMGWPDGPLFGRKFDLGEFAWLNGYRPPCDLYLSWQIPSDANPGGPNNPGYTNPLYDSACQTALGTMTEADRQLSYREVTRLFTEELPVLPLFWRLRHGIAAPHITGFTLDPTDQTFWNIEELGVGIRAVIPPGGGELTSPADHTTYLFGAGTFTDTVVITHTPLSPVVLPGFGSLTGAGHFFSLEATLNGLPVAPAQPFTMTVNYTAAELWTVNEDTLALYYWDGNTWVQEPTAVVDLLNNRVVAQPNHFSYWALLGDTYQFMLIPLVSK